MRQYMKNNKCFILHNRLAELASRMAIGPHFHFSSLAHQHMEHFSITFTLTPVALLNILNVVLDDETLSVKNVTNQLQHPGPPEQ